jgi:hypothetical protein
MSWSAAIRDASDFISRAKLAARTSTSASNAATRCFEATRGAGTGEASGAEASALC